MAIKIERKKHINFNAVKFATDIIVSYYDCIRHDEGTGFIPTESIVDFVNKIEEDIDFFVNQRRTLEQSLEENKDEFPNKYFPKYRRRK